MGKKSTREQREAIACLCLHCGKPLSIYTAYSTVYHPECKQERLRWLQNEAHKRKRREKKQQETPAEPDRRFLLDDL